jgi:Transposase DDE domain
MSLLLLIFCQIDDFCKQKKYVHPSKALRDSSKKQRNRACKLTVAEIMTITLMFHQSGYKTFKSFYKNFVLVVWKTEFPGLVSYNRFVELKNSISIYFGLFCSWLSNAECTGISFIDSFPLIAAHIKRASSHKSLKKLARKGKTSTGWFFGMKLHIIMNHRSEIINFAITSGNTADNNATLLDNLIGNKVIGKLIGDKGYLLNKEMLQKLFTKGVQVITKVRKNMKNQFMSLEDKKLLRARGLIESVGNVLKEGLNLEHTRHRSVIGFFTHVASTIAAYAIYGTKPKSSLFNNQKYLAA